MPTFTRSLNGAEWRLRPSDPAAFALPEDSVPARVPGNVQDDLEQALVLSPLRYGLGDPRWAEIHRTGWVYDRTITLEPGDAAERRALVFDGVDFACTVRLNGREVGRNAGMFRRFTLDITDAARPGENVLEVHVERMPESLEAALAGSDGAQSGAETPDFFVFANNQIRRTVKDLKSPATCSYDWATNTWALGIWRDVDLRSTGRTRLDDLRVMSDVTAGNAKLVVRASVDSLAGQPVVLRAELRDPAGVVVDTSEVLAHPAAGVSVIETGLTVDEPELWWPTGHGDQPLYTVHAALVDPETERASDSRGERIGLRRVEWEQVDGADPDFINPFMLVLNGRRIRTMGSNLVSPSLLFGTNERSGARYLDAAKAAGMNTLRIHGGGVTLPPAMYDRADELGILLLHEFPLGNCAPEADDEFLANLDVTVRSIVRQLRNHPSIVEWGGGNELHWRQSSDHPALETMRRAVAEEDDRLFRATCPMEGSRHSPWHHNPARSYAHYNDRGMTDNIGTSPLMRYGEFGTQTPAALEVWQKDIPEASRWPIDGTDDPVLVRKNVTNAVFSDDYWLTLPLIEELFGVSRSLEGMIAAGQFLGAEGLRYAVDALRRRGGTLGGFTTWDFNEPWPNGAGSFVIDYDGRPLLNFDFFSQALDPVAISLEYDTLVGTAAAPVRIRFGLVSDLPEAAGGFAWEWRARDLDGAVFASGAGVSGELASQEAVEVDHAELASPGGGAFLVEALVTGPDGTRLSERVHLFGEAGVRAPFSAFLPQGRRAPDEWLPAAGADPSTADNLAAAANGGRIVAISGAEVRDEYPGAGLIDGRYATPADGFGSGAVWHSVAEEGWFELELGAEASVTRIVLGRDRSGTHGDRTIDRLRLETSLDGREWTTVAEFDRLAALLGDRAKASHARSNPGAAEEMAAAVAYRPRWSLDLAIPTQRARYLRATVRGRSGEQRFVALDEIEVYADPAVDVAAPAVLVRDGNETRDAIAQTELSVSVLAHRADARGEELVLEVSNLGAQTALFCEPHPELAYQADLEMRGRNVSVPPGESRQIVIVARAGSADAALVAGLTLEDLGWRVTSWNAPDAVVAPRERVLAVLGRQDDTVAWHGSRAAVVTPSDSLTLEFDLPEPAPQGCEVHLITSDRAVEGASITFVANGDPIGHRSLPAGYGVQLEDPQRLGRAHVTVIRIHERLLRQGRNTLIVRADAGWAAVDAMRVAVNAAGTGADVTHPVSELVKESA